MTKEQIEIVKECLLERVRYDEQVGKETTFYDRLANVGGALLSVIGILENGKELQNFINKYLGIGDTNE